MFLKKSLLALLGICLSSMAAAAGSWQEGTHYFRLSRSSAPSTEGVEVTDVFSYACPACNAFEPVWTRIRAALPPSVKVSYLPASFNPQEDWPVFQRAFLAAQALGISQDAHEAVYDAVWKSRELAVIDTEHHRALAASEQPNIQKLAHFYARFGVAEDRFLAQANSFSTDAQMRRADQLIAAYEVDSTPTIIINRKYRVTPGSAGGYAQMSSLVQYLVGLELAGH